MRTVNLTKTERKKERWKRESESKERSNPQK